MLRQIGVVLAILGFTSPAAHKDTSISQYVANPLWVEKLSMGQYEIQVKPQAKEWIDLGGGVRLELTLVPAGRFQMGSTSAEQERATRAVMDAGLKGFDFSDEAPRHEVEISKPFLMGTYEVTNGQYAAFAKESGYKTDAEKEGWAFASKGKQWGRVEGASWFQPGYDTADAQPVSCVSFRDAVTFCEWASKKSGRPVRLPTEAEWEYACRAGTSTAFPWGDVLDDGKEHCNAPDETARKSRPFKITFNWDDGYLFPAPCGTFRPNRFGLYDMIGNVWERCADGYGRDYYLKSEKVDPQGIPSSQQRVIRGGGWDSIPWRCRSAARHPCGPENRDYSVGFRIVVAPR